MFKGFDEVKRRWPALFIMLALAVSALMLAFFMELTRETLFRHRMDVFDNSTIWLIRYFASPGIDHLMIGITTLGSGYFYVFLLSVVLLTLVYSTRWIEALGLAVCVSGGAFLNYLLKHLFERARPDMFRVVQEAGYSFPSGHAMVSFCFYGMVAFLIARNIKSWRGRFVIITMTVILVVVIGISRIYLGVHYPTDVVAGYAAGATWLAFCISLLLWWDKKTYART